MTTSDAEQTEVSLANWEWLQYRVGSGNVAAREDNVYLSLGENDGSIYGDAQLDDYHDDGVLRWRPPVRMQIRARFSHDEASLRGTAGFGYWNDPFGMTQQSEKQRALPRAWVPWLRMPRLRMPQAVWFFFAAPPSNMPLALDVAGVGWKAATLDGSSWLAKVLLPFAPLGMLLCRWGWAYRHLWPVAQHVLKLDEALLPVEMNTWHEYALEWTEQGSHFYVDGEEIFSTPHAPRGPLGLVIWIDNQMMVATPQGVIRSGIVVTDEQWLEIASLRVTAG